MDIAIDEDEHSIVVTPTGDIDATTADVVYRTVTGAAEAGWPTVVLDLSQVTFVDSVALGMLVRMRDDLPASFESRLVLRAPSERVRSLLRLTGLSTEFDVADQ